jgi:phospholipase/carboxylesterase
MTKPDFIHIFIPSSEITGKELEHSIDKDKLQLHPVCLLLLHGTGGDENDLIPMARMLSPDASLLSIRGKVLENGMPRFFRRVSEGVFDLEDLKFRTQELAEFVTYASQLYAFALDKTIAVGFSNGANMAASLLLLHPEVINRAILFRAMIPFVPDDLPNLNDKEIILSAGLRDPIVSRDEIIELSKLFQKCGATVILKWQQAGHNLIESDITDAKEWLSKTYR